MKNRVMAIALALLLPVLAQTASAEDYFEGFQYQRINPGEQTNVPEGKVEVVEMFWYGCGHCYAFEPHLHEWLQRKPANVEFVRIPAIFNSKAWRLHAQAYYTAEVLGLTDKIHGPLLDAIHKDKRQLNSEQSLAEFFAGYGVDKKKFSDTMGSFAVQVKVNRAERLTQRYGLTGVPTLIVAGKYRTEGSLAGSYQGMLNVVEHLVAKEAAPTKAAEKN